MYVVKVWNFIRNEYVTVTGPMGREAALAEQERRRVEHVERFGTTPDMTRHIIEGEAAGAARTHMECSR